MGYPAGMATTTIKFSNPGTFLGQKASRVTMAVVSTASIVWAATGESIYNFGEVAIPADGTSGAVQVPCVDQPGVVDQSGQAITMWAYHLTCESTYGTQNKTVQKVCQPLLGQDFIDFDTLPGGAAGTVVTTTIPPVTSVAGLTSVVDAAALAGVLAPFLPDPSLLMVDGGNATSTY